MQIWDEYIEHLKMDLQLRIFIAVVMIQGLPLPWFKLPKEEYSEDSLILVGLQIPVIYLINYHSCSLSIQKISILLSKIIKKQYTAIHYMVLHLAMITTSMYLTTQIKIKTAMLYLVLLTIFHKIIPLIIHYWLMESKIFRQLKLRYTLLNSFDD